MRLTIMRYEVIGGLTEIVGKTLGVAGMDKFKIKRRPNEADAEIFQVIALSGFITGRDVLMKDRRLENGARQPFKEAAGLMAGGGGFVKKSSFRKTRWTDRIHGNMNHLQEYNPANELSDDMYALR